MAWGTEEAWPSYGDWKVEGSPGGRRERKEEGRSQEKRSSSYYWSNLRENNWENERVGNKGQRENATVGEYCKN